MKDLFDRIHENKGPLEMGISSRGVFCISKLEGPIQIE